MANDADKDLFQRYVEGKVPITLRGGKVINVLVTARDKLTMMRHYASSRPDAIDGIMDLINKIVSRSYPDIPKENVEAMVIMESEALSRELLIYFDLMTREEYEERRAKTLGIDSPKKNNQPGAVPSDASGSEKQGDGQGGD